jgi:four helix bundle protein
MEKSHKKLDVWLRSFELAKSIYEVTKKFPAEEKYGLISQMRRAAVSIPSNIAEGSARQTKKDALYLLLHAARSVNSILK